MIYFPDFEETHNSFRTTVRKEYEGKWYKISVINYFYETEFRANCLKIFIEQCYKALLFTKIDPKRVYIPENPIHVFPLDEVQLSEFKRFYPMDREEIREKQIKVPEGIQSFKPLVKHYDTRRGESESYQEWVVRNLKFGNSIYSVINKNNEQFIVGEIASYSYETFKISKFITHNSIIFAISEGGGNSTQYNIDSISHISNTTVDTEQYIKCLQDLGYKVTREAKKYQTYLPSCTCKSGVLFHGGNVCCRLCRKPYEKGGEMYYYENDFKL